MMGKMISIDSGMVVVIFISLMYMMLVFGLLFYVKNDWCDLLFKNFTVRPILPSVIREEKNRIMWKKILNGRPPPPFQETLYTKIYVFFVAF